MENREHAVITDSRTLLFPLKSWVTRRQENNGQGTFFSKVVSKMETMPSKKLTINEGSLGKRT